MQLAKLPEITTFSSTLIFLANPIYTKIFLNENTVIHKETISRPFKLIGELTLEEYRATKIKSLRGKYRHVLSSTEEFISEKRKIEL